MTYSVIEKLYDRNKQKEVVIPMNQSERVLSLFCRLLRGEYVNKENYSVEFQITERSFARDIHHIRYILAEMHLPMTVCFDTRSDSYYLSNTRMEYLEAMDVMVLLKILIGSRSLRQDEMTHLVQVLYSCLQPEDKKEISQRLRDILTHYTGPQHQKAVVKMQWDLSCCITRQYRIRLQYHTYTKKTIYREVFPVDIISSRCYFYLIAFLVEKTTYPYPAFFRIDRISSFQILPVSSEDEPYRNFSFSQMADSLFDMYGGERENVQLWCRYSALEAVLDMLPEHQILEYQQDGVIVTACVFTEGFLHWIPTQGENVEILSPPSLRNALAERLEAMIKKYR